MERNILSLNVDTVQDFSYVLPKIYLEKSKLLKVEAYERLATSDDLSSFFDILNRTRYFLKPITLDAQPRDVEKLLKKDLLTFSYKIVDLASNISNTFMRTYLSIYELINLKITLRLAALGFEEEQILANLPVPLEGLKTGSIFLQIARIKDLKETLNLLKNLDFYYYPAFEAIQLSDRFQESYLIESFIDKWYFTSLFDECMKLNEFERKNILQIVGVEVDTYNLLSVSRGQNLGLDSEELQECLVSRYYNITEKSIEKMLDGEASFYETIEDSDYASLLPEIHAPLEDWELTFRRLIYKASNRFLLQIPFQTGTIMSILKLKEFEIGNLLAIMYGLDFELDSDDILQQLIM